MEKEEKSMALSSMKLVRESLGLSQYQLSQLTSIPNYRISLLENGWRKPTITEIKKIGEAMGVDLKLLMNKKIKIQLTDGSDKEK